MYGIVCNYFRPAIRLRDGHLYDSHLRNHQRELREVRGQKNDRTPPSKRACTVQTPRCNCGGRHPASFPRCRRFRSLPRLRHDSIPTRLRVGLTRTGAAHAAGSWVEPPPAPPPQLTPFPKPPPLPLPPVGYSCQNQTNIWRGSRRIT